MTTIPRTAKFESESVVRPDEERRHLEELHRDRIVGVLILLGFLTAVGLLIWLGSQGGASPSGDYLEFIGA